MSRVCVGSSGVACAFGLALVLGCRQDSLERRLELEEISARRAGEVAKFDEARQEFEHRNATPQRLDLGPDGTLLIEDCALLGRIGHEELRVDYTYVNTTGHAIAGARVTLTLRDPASGEARDEWMDLGFPSLRLGPDSTYTAHFQVPTRGIHSQPGWSWEIRATVRK